MNKVFFLFAILSMLLLASCKDKVVVERTYYPDGTIWSEMTKKDGVLDGPYIVYHRNGKKELSVNYVNGVVEGLYTTFYYKGVRKEETMYVNGIREGESRTYNDFGNPEKEMFYKNDKLDGPYIEFYNLDEIKVLGSYKEGMMDGPWSFWDMQGEKMGEGTFDMGKGMLIRYHDNGVIASETPFVENDSKHGVEKFYDVQGKLVEEVTYEDNVEIARKNY